MAAKITKKSPGITTSREVGFDHPKVSESGGYVRGGNGPAGATNITVDRSVSKPPTRKPSK